MLVTGIQRYIKPVSAREGVRLMHRCWLQPVQSRGDKHRQAEEDPLEGWWSERPAVYLVLHLHCLLLKSTSVFAVPQCVLTFQVKKVPLASSAGVWAAVLCLTGPSREWVPLTVGVQLVFVSLGVGVGYLSSFVFSFWPSVFYSCSW